MYEPAVLIVGTRGRNLNGMQSLLPGSVSKYCLQQSPIPVIVVRPEVKRNEKKSKRSKDPNRQSRGLVMDMDRRRSRVLNNSSSTDDSISRLPGEEAAVAEAVGLRLSSANSRSSFSLSERSSTSHDEGRPASPGSATFDAVVMKSPMAGSVENSDNESSGSRPASGDFSALGEVFDSNTSTPQAGASTPQGLEADTGADTKKPRVSIPRIVTEEFQDKDPSG